MAKVMGFGRAQVPVIWKHVRLSCRAAIGHFRPLTPEADQTLERPLHSESGQNFQICPSNVSVTTW
jgi:hypothetical protein